MATYLDYGLPTDPLSGPSLADWAAGVATELTGHRTVLVPATGWGDQVGAYASANVTRVGGLVVVDATIARTGAGLAVTAGTDYQIATVPSGYWPAHTVQTQSTASLAATTTYTGVRIVVTATGAISFTAPTATTIPTGGWVAVTFTYRGA